MSFSLINILLVAFGGALGSICRYLISIKINNLFALNYFSFIATLSVNVVGSLAMGILAFFVVHKLSSQIVVLFLGVGFLGSFTTFSTFSWETLNLLHQGMFQYAIVNIVLNFSLTLLAVWVGFKVSKLLFV